MGGVLSLLSASLPPAGPLSDNIVYVRALSSYLDVTDGDGDRGEDAGVRRMKNEIALLVRLVSQKW